MSKQLRTLIDLRVRELEERQAELTAKQALCVRVETNIERLNELVRGVGSDFACADLALNTAAYKQSVLQLAENQRQELQRQRADLSQAQEAVQAAAIRQEVLGRVLQRHLTLAQVARQRHTQKLQDDLANQVWSRGRHEPT